EIDAIALVEIRLGLAGNDRGQVQNDVGTRRYVRGDGSRIGNVESRERHLTAEAGGLFRRRDVDERERGDLPAGELALARQPFGELAADHAGGADDEYMHRGASMWS